MRRAFVISTLRSAAIRSRIGNQGARWLNEQGGKDRSVTARDLRPDIAYCLTHWQLVTGTMTVPLGRYFCTSRALHSRTMPGPGYSIGYGTGYVVE